MCRHTIEASVLVVGHGEPVGFRGEADSLRRAEVADVMRDLAHHKVDHLDGVVSESGDEEPFALRIELRVIDPTLDAVQWNRMDLSQQVGPLARVLRVGVATEREHRGDDEQKQLSRRFS
jgi:hypothetical protein